MRWVWQAVETERAAERGVVRRLITSGQRRGEVAGLDWKELSRADREWHLPAARAKNGCENVIPLTAAEVAELDKIAGGSKWPRSGFVYPSSAAKPLRGFSKLKRRIDASMAKEAEKVGAVIDPWTLHDLRRTLATRMQRLGILHEVVEHLLNHREKSRAGIAKVYQTHDFKPEKLAALERWEADLRRVLEGEAGTVIPFARPA